MADSLPTAQRVALGYASRTRFACFSSIFALDAHCGHLLRHSKEPMLAQMRLAWWREALARPVEDWPRGNPLFEHLSVWAGEEQALIRLVEGWEYLTGEAPLPAAEFEHFAARRADAFVGLARLIGAQEYASSCRAAAYRWAVADLCQGLTHPEERDHALSIARALDPSPIRLPRALRPLGVLDTLARLAIRRGGGPLFADRHAAAVALRYGLIGR